MRVTCEVAPHHFTLTDEMLGAPIAYDTNTKMNPPLRETADRDAMIAGIVDGTVDAIATDHAPHHYDEKQVEFDRAPFGIVGLETAVSLTFDRLLHTRSRPSAAARRAAVVESGADSQDSRRHARRRRGGGHHDPGAGPEGSRQCTVVPIALQEHAVRRLGAARRRRRDDRRRPHGVHEPGGRAEEHMNRREEIREKALTDLQQHEVLMFNGHFDFGNGITGASTSIRTSCSAIPRRSGALRRMCSTFSRPRSSSRRKWLPGR